MRADPSPRYAHLTLEERQARLDALALALMTADTPDRRSALWEEMAEVRMSTPKDQRNALARARGLPEEP
jgi:hypothetical protein